MKKALKINKKRLRELRKDNRYTHKHIANVLGYRFPTSYQAVETGNKNMTEEKLIVLAKFYNVSVDELLIK